MKAKLLLIAAVAVISAQSAQAAWYKITNSSSFPLYVYSYSEGLSAGQSKVLLQPGETSETIKTGAHGVEKIEWSVSDSPSLSASLRAQARELTEVRGSLVEMPAAILTGKVIIGDKTNVDTYKYNWGTGIKSGKKIYKK